MNRPASEIVALALRKLRAAQEPLTAVKLAGLCGLDGSRETRRRKVRAIVKQLRDDGQQVVADGCGYFIAPTDRVWRDYLEGRKIDAKKIFAEIGKKKRITDGHGQSLLFNPMGGFAL